MSDYSGPELCALSATEAVRALEAGEVSPAEMIDAAVERIEAVEPAINALPTLCPDRARSAAAALQKGDEATWLAGLPIAIKDLSAVEGVRTTFGTKACADFVPEATDPLVERLENRGGVVLAKSNTPEMGAGGNTFNAVFGATKNPWNTDLNPGGSSGGAAAALATGEIWLAHGSDLGGSLRTPAAYCGVIGLRPSPGRAGGSGPEYAFAHESLQGPMARTAEDCALFLDAMSGFDPRWPTSLPAPEVSYRDAVAEAEPPKRIAFAPDMNGLGEVEDDVAALMAGAMRALEGAGTAVEEACPDLTDLPKHYYTLRAMVWAAGPGQAPEEVTRHFKATLQENIDDCWSLSARDIIGAANYRSRLYATAERFFRDFDAIACPVVGLGALPSEIEYPTEVGGKKMGGYMEWLEFSFFASTIGLPAISVPIGFCPSGAPMGIQFVGRPRGEAGLLQIAKVMESLIPGFGAPIDPRPAA